MNPEESHKPPPKVILRVAVGAGNSYVCCRVCAFDIKARGWSDVPFVRTRAGLTLHFSPSEAWHAMKFISGACALLLASFILYGASDASRVSKPAPTEPAPQTPLLAATPPLGWNSWDGYGTTVNEAQVKSNAEWFAKHLKPFGWQYIVVDMEWFVTNPTPEGNSKSSQLSLDSYGRST